MNEAKSKKELVADNIYIFTRLGILASVVLMFFPFFNPAKVCTLVNKNMSLFTSAVSYTGLTQDVATGFKYHIVNEQSFYLLMISSIIAVIGIVVMAVGACMSLGNLKLKKAGNLFALLGSLVMGGSLIGTYNAYNQIIDTVTKYDLTEGERYISNGREYISQMSIVAPSIPTGFWIFLAIAAVVFVLSLVSIVCLPKVEKGMKFQMETKYRLFLVMLPFIILVFIFSYLPLYGWIYAFFDYKPGTALTSENFVGFKWFTRLFSDAATRSDVLMVLRNTLVMSGLGLATSWVPMAFAILLNEIHCKWFKRIVQVFTTIPNFVSWVLVFALAFAMFSSDGFINTAFNLHTDVLGNPSGTWFKMLLWGMWKGTGWSAIIYVAGISGIDTQLYEAATVDGAGRFQKMMHITVPGLMPTFFVLLLMAIANVLTNGLDQYLVFYNVENSKLITVLDLYVYQLGLGSTNTIPLSTVVSMAKSIVSVILLLAANGVSKLIRGESIM